MNNFHPMNIECPALMPISSFDTFVILRISGPHGHVSCPDSMFPAGPRLYQTHRPISECLCQAHAVVKAALLNAKGE